MDRLYVLDCESDTVTQNLLVSECNVVEKGSTLMDEVELQLMPRSQQEDVISRDKIPQFQAVEYYLQHSSSVPSTQQVREDLSWTDVALRSGGTGDGGGDPQKSMSVTLLANTHHALQLLSICHSLQLSTLHPDCAFSVYCSHPWQSESFFTARSASSTLQ